MKHYLLQVAIAFDQLMNALLGGWADETLSSCAWRMERDGKPWGKFWRPVIDTIALIFKDKDHCHNSYLAERDSTQLAPEFRKKG